MWDPVEQLDENAPCLIGCWDQTSSDISGAATIVGPTAEVACFATDEPSSSLDAYASPSNEGMVIIYRDLKRICRSVVLGKVVRS